jgi:universal stress protein A
VNGYKHVLVAVDFSEETNAILDKAAEISQFNKCGLTLFHAVECSDALYVSDLVMPVDMELCEDMAKKGKNRLIELAGELDLAVVETRVSIGVAKHEIIRAASEAKADLIVLGSHGRHGLQLLLGSTANGVMHLAQCDVLAVRVNKDL